MESGAVQCTKCEMENRAGRKFCASCGAELLEPCPHCSFPNQSGERYCGGCGHLLAGASAVTEETEGQAKKREGILDPQGDRRPVTVLFCDLVGYTQLSSALDAEDVH